jgi:hypothetical protein
MSRIRRVAALLIAFGALGCVPEAVAQSPELLLLAPQHEAVRAVRLLEAAGHVSALPPQRALRVGTVTRAFREAALHGDPDVAAAARAWLERLPAGPAGGHATVLARRHTGVAAPGWAYYDPDRTGAEPRPDSAGIRAGGGVRAEFDRGYGAAEASLGSGGPRLDFGEAAVAVGPFVLSAGRTYQGYGRASQGIVLSGVHTFDGVTLDMLEPVVLPGWLRFLGPFAAHSALSRLPEERHPGSSYFWMGAFSLQPHARLNLAVHRGAVFGGGVAPEPITLRNLAYMLIGKHVPGNFENQVVSVELGYRLPIESVQPAFVYLEWGSEDSAGAFRNVPGRIFGILLPELAFAPRASLRLERAELAGSCCGNPAWYRHTALPGGWASGDRPYGHEIGGHGQETRLELELASAEAGLVGRAGVGRRVRGEENLYAPGRENGAWITDGGVRWSASDRLELSLSGWREAGSDWTETRLESRARITF